MGTLRTIWIATLDALFGKREAPLTLEEQKAAEIARPPRILERIYSMLLLGSTVAIAVGFAWSHGWLPYIHTEAPTALLTWLIALNLLTQLVWDYVVVKHYRRRALAHSQP